RIAAIATRAGLPDSTARSRGSRGTRILLESGDQLQVDLAFERCRTRLETVIEPDQSTGSLQSHSESHSIGLERLESIAALGPGKTRDRGGMIPEQEHALTMIAHEPSPFE